eukprot:GDKJ01056388.1.p1 GENE.GDKJ01056388.1~~GDKJ01056388.1.p1  ORF type:complete len:195 (-),score=28.48 GDKJ01056388.1:149-733(-)
MMKQHVFHDFTSPVRMESAISLVSEEGGQVKHDSSQSYVVEKREENVMSGSYVDSDVDFESNQRACYCCVADAKPVQDDEKNRADLSRSSQIAVLVHSAQVMRERSVTIPPKYDGEKKNDVNFNEFPCSAIQKQDELVEESSFRRSINHNQLYVTNRLTSCKRCGSHKINIEKTDSKFINSPGRPIRGFNLFET